MSLAGPSRRRTKFVYGAKHTTLPNTQKLRPALPLAFNTLGWNSVYTRQPIPEEDMREWVQTTVERILTLAPRNVLEIGCGTGLLLLRIAPTCARYIGVDFFPSSAAKAK